MKVAIVGAGAWGTALAKLAADAGHAVSVWAHEPEVVAQLRAGRNEMYLPDIALPPLEASEDLRAVVTKRDVIISVMPSHVVREVWSGARGADLGEPLVVSATKGIENVTLATMIEVLREALPLAVHSRLAALSGPSFASEVGQGLPTAVVAAARELATAKAVQEALSTPTFRIYTSTDVPGVEVGGAVKNVIAIAAGIAEGLGFGHNTRAALVTRGVAEITRLAVAKAANPMTLAGLAGIGDLVLTCTGGLSRNRAVGLALGRGESLDEILGATRSVAEGINSAASCLGLARRLGVDMPITETVYGVLYDGLDAREATAALMQRRLKHELEHAK